MTHEPLYLVDGSGYIFRAYYAVQPLSNSKGLPTNALFGFSRMLTKLLRDVSAKYIAVTFDRGEKTFRHEKYELYKANRAECPTDLVPQMPYFRSLVSAYGIQVLEQSGVEADDIIATIVERKSSPDQPIIIVSGDKDLCQLVTTNVTVWDAMRDIHYDPAGVEAKFGVKPEQIIDLLALIGDTSDNVPGISGIGPKTATQVLQHFGSIDNLMLRLAEVESLPGLRGAKRVRDLLEKGREGLALSRELVTLKKDVSPFLELSDPDDFLWTGHNEEKLTALLTELEFRSPFSKEVKENKDKKARSDVKVTEEVVEKEIVKRETATQAVLFGEAKPLSTPSKDFVTVKEADLPRVLEEIRSSSFFAFDTETSSLDPFSAELAGVSLSTAPGRGYFIPTQNVSLEKFSEIFLDKNKQKLGSNIKFDIAVLRTNGIAVLPPFGDSMLASYVLNPDHRQHGLKDLSRRWLHEEMTTYEEMLGEFDSIYDVPLERLTQYAAHDAEATLRIHEILVSKLSEGQKAVYQTIEVPLISVLEEMERTGIRVDEAALIKLSEEFQCQIIDLERELYQLAGKELNLNSPKQLSQLLFEELKLPTAGIKKTTHGFSTDAGALERLSKHHPLPLKLLEYREIFKLKSTYVDSLKGLIRKDTGRVHTSFNQAVAATGRLSSSDPNLQNIPIKNERGRRIRSAFVADEGWKLISADYSQVELRILAHLSGDEKLIHAFQSGEDIHTRTAELIFRDRFSSADDATRKELRRYAKTINFGVIYGMGPVRLADELGISRGEASQFIESYFGTYEGVRHYFSELESEALRKGYVETIFGRRRYLRDIDTSGRDPRYAVRSALNAPLQGTAADIMKVAMINVFEALQPMKDQARLLLQVHDELLVEAKDEAVKEIEKLIVEKMSSAASLRVPLLVESRISQAWS